MKKTYLFLTLTLLGITNQVRAEHVQALVYFLTPTGLGEQVGTISFKDTSDGLFVEENFSRLLPGPHGIHVHENGSCDPTTVDGKTVLGGAAGGHFDPQKTGEHKGPNKEGHKGDLPVLSVDAIGNVATSFYLKGINASDFKGRSVIIHTGGDNYSDSPKPLGGGGDRIACGVIK